MIYDDFAELALFITGPTYIRKETRQAGALPEFGHRDTENIKRFGPIMDNLRKIAQVDEDYTPLIYNGSGSTALESSVKSLVAPSDKVLNVSVGAFGDLFHKIAVLNGKNAHQLKFEYGQTMDMNRLKETLNELKPDVVTITHNETSTGVENDIVTACHMIHSHGAMSIVDGVSIFGGAPSKISQAKPAMYCTATQKSLALPAGFGIGFINEQAAKKAKLVPHRGYATDILNQLAKAEKFQTLSTPNTALANQMCVQLDYIVNSEGIENRFARHLRLRDMVHEFVNNLYGFSLAAPEGYRSPTLTAIRCPESISFDDLKSVKELMRERGYLFDPGYSGLNKALTEKNQPPIFRIGHMGDITEDMLRQYLDVLRPLLTA